MTGRSMLARDDLESIPVPCGVPRGSILGPTLWNVFYDRLLGLDIPSGVLLMGFADDFALVAVVPDGPYLEACTITLP